MAEAVVDTSVFVELLLGEESLGEYAGWHAHVGVDLEVLSVLRRHALHGTVPPNMAREAIDVFRTLDIARHPVSRLIPRIWVMRHEITAYDAGYVALAEALGIPLITLDKKLAKTAQRYCDVIVP